VAFLALRDRPVLRTLAAGMLWPETSEERAAANLRSALWRTRRLGLPVIEATSTRILLAHDVDVDVWELAAVARRIQHHAKCRHADVEVLVRSAELLPGWYDDWVLLERERFRQLRLHTLEVACERLTRAGRYWLAVEAGLAMVADEPLRESAHRVLIRVYLAEGNSGEAVRQYRRYRQLLHQELGLDPSPQMETLVRGLGIPVTDE
jgi:DNA-binding SARP family transcriptional activator